jgi:hypothetical protein
VLLQGFPSQALPPLLLPPLQLVLELLQSVP